jgi:hypothetical protein
MDSLVLPKINDMDIELYALFPIISDLFWIEYICVEKIACVVIL